MMVNSLYYHIVLVTLTATIKLNLTYSLTAYCYHIELCFTGRTYTKPIQYYNMALLCRKPVACYYGSYTMNVHRE